MIKNILILFLLFLTCHQSIALELNYRLLDKPHIQNFIDNQLDSIDSRFSNFVVDVIGIDTNTNLLIFIKTYNELTVMITLFRNNCVYALLEGPVPTAQKTQSCREVSNKLLSLVRQLDDSLLISILNTKNRTTPNKEPIYQSNSYFYLEFAITSVISKLEPSISNVTLVAESRNQAADQFSLEIGNQLSVLHKTIRQVITELVPTTFRRDLENFWLYYINVLQERSTAKERRDYWAVNVFDLNIRLNEFFYSCERNEKLLSKTSYNLCDNIHKDWNNIFRQTLKF